MDTDTKIDKWFTGKMGFFIQIATLVVSITIAIMALKTDIALIYKDIDIINTNHLTHIQAEIKEIKESQKQTEDKLTEILLLIKATHEN
jgi:hypothetical protein